MNQPFFEITSDEFNEQNYTTREDSKSGKKSVLAKQSNIQIESQESEDEQSKEHQTNKNRSNGRKTNDLDIPKLSSFQKWYYKKGGKEYLKQKREDEKFVKIEKKARKYEVKKKKYLEKINKIEKRKKNYKSKYLKWKKKCKEKTTNEMTNDFQDINIQDNIPNYSLSYNSFLKNSKF